MQKWNRYVLQNMRRVGENLVKLKKFQYNCSSTIMQSCLSSVRIRINLASSFTRFVLYISSENISLFGFNYCIWYSYQVSCSLFCLSQFASCGSDLGLYSLHSLVQFSPALNFVTNFVSILSLPFLLHPSPSCLASPHLTTLTTELKEQFAAIAMSF